MLALRRRQARQAVRRSSAASGQRRRHRPMRAPHGSDAAACARRHRRPNRVRPPSPASPRWHGLRPATGAEKRPLACQVIARPRSTSLLRNTKRRSAAATLPGRHRAAASRRRSSSNLSSANSAITRPFGVSQPFHCHSPSASDVHVVHELRLRRKPAHRGLRRRATDSRAGQSRARAGCGLSRMGVGLNIRGL